MNIKKGYSFDDVLLIPQKSSIQHRGDVDTSVNVGKLQFTIPIVSANMKHVTGPEMAKTIAKLGGIGLLHRFNDFEGRVQDFIDAIDLHLFDGTYVHGRYTDERISRIGISVGTNDQEKLFLDHICDHKYEIKDLIKIICIDVAHGHHQMTYDMVKEIRSRFSDSTIIAGNIATGEGACYLAEAGVNVVKVGVGGGSLCTTRIETGNGVPQLTALEDTYNGLKSSGFDKVKIIADGGIKKAGDIVKALCFSDMVMIGNLLAGTDQAPGEIIVQNNQRYKQYAGSSTHKSSHIEGVVGLVPYRGNVKDVIERLMQGVRSGLSYQGVDNLADLKDGPQFVEISNAGLIESKPHDVLY